MSKETVAQFFASVYNDRKLQGALHYALAKSAPEVLVEIAKAKGISFTKEDLGSVLEAESGEVSGFMTPSQLSIRSLRTPVWQNVGRFGLGSRASGFELTIPGPSFVKVQSCDDLDRREQAQEDANHATVSAVETYRSLVAE